MGVATQEVQEMHLRMSWSVVIDVYWSALSEPSVWSSDFIHIDYTNSKSMRPSLSRISISYRSHRPRLILVTSSVHIS